MTQDVQLMKQTTPEETTGRRFVSLEEGFRAAEALQAQAVANGVAGMSMDEIDAIVAECRREMREERDAVQAVRKGYCDTAKAVFTS